jgi:hypothetical protein
VNPFFIAIPMFLVCLLIGYVLRELSLRNLEITQAGALVLAVRPIRIRLAVAMGCILMIFLLLRFALPHFAKSPFAAIVFLLLFAAIVIAQVAGRRAIVRAQLPRTFIRLHDSAQVFEFLAYVALFGGMAAATLLYRHA